MTDKRILKTKKALKSALIELVSEKPFDNISVTEICTLANTGRITFYTHYDDKYDLLQDIFSDLKNDVMMDYKARQAESKEPDNTKSRFLNLIDSILDLMGKYSAASRNLSSNNELLFLYYQFVLETLDTFELSAVKSKRRYDKDQLNSFLALGFWGFIHTRPSSGKPAKENTNSGKANIINNTCDIDKNKLRRDAHMLVSDLIDSGIME